MRRLRLIKVPMSILYYKIGTKEAENKIDNNEVKFNFKTLKRRYIISKRYNSVFMPTRFSA